MSAKGRRRQGEKVAPVEGEAFMTPGWATRALIEWLEAELGWNDDRFLQRVLDAGCGSGAIAAEFAPLPWVRSVEGVEVDGRCAPFYEQRLRAACSVRLDEGRGLYRFSCRDFLVGKMSAVDLVVGNPPFSKAMAFARRGLEHPGSPVVALLLRMHWLRPNTPATRGEHRPRAFFDEHPPFMGVLERRPGFVPGSQTDAAEYAWMVWNSGCEGQWAILPCEPRQRGAR